MERYEVNDEAWEMREVYAKFGVAAYFAQVVETGLANHIAYVRMSRHKRHKPFDGDKLLRGRFSQPFGTNANELRDLLGEDWPLADDVAAALALRNDLIHHFWRTRILKTGHPAGREELAEELDRAIEQFQEIDGKLTTATTELVTSLGITPEQIGALLAEVEAAARGEREEDPDWIV